MNSKRMLLLAAALLTLTVTLSFAAGPLLIFDEATQTPYAWGPGVVPIYTDLGNNGLLTGAESDANTANGYAQWSAVPTSSFSAAIAGDFSTVGLPDITGANAGLVVGTFNGGGIHVMYDDDGTITFNFFGAPPGVLGISSPDFAVGGTNEISESWAMLNGTAADPGDIGGTSFAGVFTHEFGHSINLAHVQVVGSVGFFGDNIGPGGCPTPYAGLPTLADFETMYPYLDPSPGSTGVYQATVEHPDDISSISNIYPTGGWPATNGTISGVVYEPNGITEITGINVIARNVADPFGDAVSALSGDYTQGVLGPDGRFTLNGLTPGADYVVYIDEIVSGGFSTPPDNIPGDGNEEYWNTSESGDPGVDDPCDYTTIMAVAGSPATADIIVNGDPNNLGLGDDDTVEIPLPFSFPFCGANYSTVWVCSNGFVTFGVAETYWVESVADLLAGPPRIAPLWDDLNPTQGGSVTAMPSGGDFVISWNNVPEYFNVGSNSFSLTLHADGTYDMDYGDISATDGLAGRSPGNGAADYGPTDLSAEPQPIGVGLDTVYELFLGGNDLANTLLAFGTCVVPDIQEISVSPTSLTAYLQPGAMEDQVLTISNLGDLDLDWNLASDQLFGMAAPSATQTPTSTIQRKPLAARRDRTPMLGSPARLAKVQQDNQASPPAHEKISPYAVPLPHNYALSVFSEDFNSGFPAGWSAIDNEGNGVIWQVPAQGGGNDTGGTGDAAGASSDFVGPADYDTELRTPPISGFGPNVVLSYTCNYQNFAAFDYLDVDVSVDGGTNWTNVLSWNEDHGTFGGPPGEQVALNLDAFVQGYASFMVRWHWYDPTTTSDWDWWVHLDDVMVVSDEPLTPCSFLSFDPTSGTIAGDSSEDVTVTFDATGFTPGTYDCELIIFSNDPNNDRLVVPVQMVVDDTPPVITVGDAIEMWPPNHKYDTFSASDCVVSIEDNVDGTIDPDAASFASGSSDEPEDVGGNGDGHTLNDIAFSNVCKSVHLRAERQGGGNGRVYNITVEVSDQAGNVGQAVCVFEVPHDQSGPSAIDDGPAYTLDCVGDEVFAQGGKAGAPPVVGGFELVTEYGLRQNVPNPFNPTTTISFALPQAGNVTLNVYNSAGQLVRTLYSGAKGSGIHQVTWDGRADNGAKVASGVYFYRLVAGSYVETKRMVLLK